VQAPEQQSDAAHQIQKNHAAQVGRPYGLNLSPPPLLLNSGRAMLEPCFFEWNHTMKQQVPPAAIFRTAVLAVSMAVCPVYPVLAGKTTECTKIAVCYCVNGDLNELVEIKIAMFREVLAAQRRAGKAVGYMSVPLSTIGGGFFNVNMEVAAAAKTQLENRFGSGQVWILNPGVPEANIPNGTGADYMLMWTQVLEGKGGLGEDFDFVYFVGPQDFARYFGLDGSADMQKIETFFDKRLATDPDLKRAVDKGLTRSAFRNYYALKASVTFSKGAHDEWNIIRALNERRRADDRFGIANQIAVLFDGAGLTPASLEAPTSEGYAGKCVN
jgi:hypothetical protein